MDDLGTYGSLDPWLKKLDDIIDYQGYSGVDLKAVCRISEGTKIHLWLQKRLSLFKGEKMERAVHNK